MTDYMKYINALRKCANEHKNDRTSTGHIIVSDLCRDTANLLEELEQEPSIDELRAEITALQNRCYALTKGVMCGFCKYECQYKADTEADNG